MSVETNKETARRFIEELFSDQSQGDLEFAAQDYVSHDPTDKTTQGVAQNIAGFRAAFPDLHATITQLLGEGDLVAVQWTASGIHQQSLTAHHLPSEFALPATGKDVTVTAISLIRFSGGTIAEIWNHWDTHHLLSQISAV